MRRIVLVLATVALMTMSGSSAFADDGGGRTIYDSLEIAPNVPSLGPEAYSFTELGDRVTFAGSARTLDRVVVTLSSWGCQTGHWYSNDCRTAVGATFRQAITLNIYQPGTGITPGALIATQTRTFNVPYRPSASPQCTGTNTGKWSAGSLGCFNGLEKLVTFDFAAQQLDLPGTVVYGVSYNTSTHGKAPIGVNTACYTSPGGCPYDSLNIGLGSRVKVGSKPSPNTAFWDTSVAIFYCDGGADGVAIFRLDSANNACWFDATPATTQIPAVRFIARGANNGDGDNGDNGDNGN